MVSKIKNSILVMILLISHVASAQVVRTIPWKWQLSTCQSCGIKFDIVGDMNSIKDMDTKEIILRTNPFLWSTFKIADLDAQYRTKVFLETLSKEKATILNLYANETNSQEYNLLAHMAVGILGQESRFFHHYRYLIKRNAQWAITEAKIAKKIISQNRNPEKQHLSPVEAAKSLLRTDDAIIDTDDVVANSKGPTQIKDVPDRIAQHYNFTEKDLWNPKNAAVATMGYLIMALKELRQTAANRNMTYINDSTIVDYLPYKYFGGNKKLLDRTATPDKNIYINNMKRFMQKVRVSEILQ